MKKTIPIILILVLSLASIAVAADAADIRHKGRTHTVAWDPAMLETEAVCTDCRYLIYLKNKTTGTETKIGETSELLLTIVIPLEGRYWVGGLAQRTVDGEPVNSPTVWTDNPEVCLNGQTFFLDWVAAPLGMRGITRKP